MTRKGEVIEALIDLSQTRKFARLYADAPAKGRHPYVSPADLQRYAREVDNCFACLTKAVRATIKPKPRRPKRML